MSCWIKRLLVYLLTCIQAGKWRHDHVSDSTNQRHVCYHGGRAGSVWWRYNSPSHLTDVYLLRQPRSQWRHTQARLSQVCQDKWFAWLSYSGAFLAAAVWGGQRAGHICIWGGARIPDDIIDDDWVNGVTWQQLRDATLWIPGNKFYWVGEHRPTALTRRRPSPLPATP